MVFWGFGEDGTRDEMGSITECNEVFGMEDGVDPYGFDMRATVPSGRFRGGTGQETSEAFPLTEWEDASLVLVEIRIYKRTRGSD